MSPAVSEELNWNASHLDSRLHAANRGFHPAHFQAPFPGQSWSSDSSGDAVEDNFNVQQMDDLKGILVRCHASADTPPY